MLKPQMLRPKHLQNSGPLAALGALATATGGDELANGFHCGLSHQDVAVMEVATDGKPRYNKWIPTGIPLVNGSKKGVDPLHSPTKPWFLVGVLRLGTEGTYWERMI